ncbi:hypothetical protein AAFF_G00428790 [Aldrovandia affinis]|uniref:Uncharacterized protein n=1 Tax=Aldrovandia affinis TaxID=143900 RepID=A0AAD7WJI0_9TELE|nr:hypothetical protein AAFF_G00428790 [Aldrovandia affinis]
MSPRGSSGRSWFCPPVELKARVDPATRGAVHATGEPAPVCHRPRGSVTLSRPRRAFLQVRQTHVLH